MCEEAMMIYGGERCERRSRWDSMEPEGNSGGDDGAGDGSGTGGRKKKMRWADEEPTALWDLDLAQRIWDLKLQLKLCKKQEKVDMALELWNDTVEKGFKSYVLISDVLLDLLCDMGKLVEAERCFLQMIDKGPKPTNVSFRRIKVLMELANRHDAIDNLSEKMGPLGYRDDQQDPVRDHQVSKRWDSETGQAAECSCWIRKLHNRVAPP
ncbi:hypothetical protein Droror1_Dr00000478 [Drosera rotundifolia]